MSDRTKAFEEKYKGHDVLAIHNVDKDGDKIKKDQYSVVSLGVKKATAILNHIEDLRSFVAKHTEKNDE